MCSGRQCPAGCAQVQVSDMGDAHEQIDHAIATALHEQKPCYINICCNLAGLPDASFADTPVPFSIMPRHTNQVGCFQAYLHALLSEGGSQGVV